MKRERIRYELPADGQLVLPYSALVSFRACRKRYELEYEMLLEAAASGAMADGTEFHKYAEISARYRRDETISDEDRAFIGDPSKAMRSVWAAYLATRGVPEQILMAEEPLYTRLLRRTWLRTTFDLVYRDSEGWIVGRDYKTFEKAPTQAVDQDFQGRLYIAALMRFYKTDRVRFEYEYVRRVPPGTANSKGAWSEEECYINVPVVISKREADELWAEAQDAARDILRARRLGLFYRGGTRKEFGSPCFSCRYDNLCAAQLMHGRLDDQDIELLAAGRKEPIVLPAELAS